MYLASRDQGALPWHPIKFIDNSRNHDIIVVCAIVVNAIIETTTNTGA